MDSAPSYLSFIGIVDFAPEANWVFITDSVTDLLGYEPSDLLGTPSLQLVHPDEFPRVQKMHYNTIQEDKAAVIAYLRLRHKDPYKGYILCCISRTVVHNVLVGSVSFATPGAKQLHNASTAQEITVITPHARDFEFRRWNDPSPMPPDPPLPRGRSVSLTHIGFSVRDRSHGSRSRSGDRSSAHDASSSDQRDRGRSESSAASETSTATTVAGSSSAKGKHRASSPPHSRSPSPAPVQRRRTPSPRRARSKHRHSPRRYSPSPARPIAPPAPAPAENANLDFDLLPLQSFRTALILNRFSSQCPIVYCSNDLLLNTMTAMGRSFFDFVSKKDEDVVRSWIDVVKGWGVNERGQPSDGGFGYGKFVLLTEGRDSSERVADPAPPRRHGGPTRTARSGSTSGAAGSGRAPSSQRTRAPSNSGRGAAGGPGDRYAGASIRPRIHALLAPDAAKHVPVDAIFSAHSDGMLVILRGATV
ncbi:hypothetical protein HGRIS_006425 [Hohenbuehelia grisea]|uniref:PAS domain-containing protein n=1 Tax=Hohenbuehelia grisea TaxID=104357 RepID=A0ABR3K2U3_9AGAR